MAKLLKLRRGTTTQHGSFTGAEGEVTVDTDKETLVVHDGSTAGGHPVAAEDMANVSSASIAGRLANDSIATSKLAAGALPSDVTVASANLVDGTIVNADVNASAAIAGTKISPDFGSQNVVTTGTLGSGDLTLTSTGPKITFTDSDSDPDYFIQNNNGTFRLRDVTNGVDRLAVNSDGHIDIAGNLDCLAGLDVTGDITATGDLTLTNSGPKITFTDSDNNPDYFIQDDNGEFRIRDATNSADRLEINSDGSIDLNGNVNISSGVDVTGNMTVTGTVDGRDVAADGTKLDGIESGATADQTASEIASALSGQNVYVGGSNHIGFSSNDRFSNTANNHIDVQVNGSTEFRFESDGDFHADGDVIAQSTTISSDRRLKENIEVIPNALDKVLALNGVSFDWKKTGEKSAGVIAQEVQGVLPEAVKEVTPLKGGDSHLSVNYHALTSILIESIKELKAEIEELKGGK